MTEELCVNCHLDFHGCGDMFCWIGIVHPYSKRADCDCFGDMSIEEITFFELSCLCGEKK